MNGQSLTGGTDDAHHGPLWIDPFGNRGDKAAPEGFRRLSLALAQRWREQVGSLSAACSLGNLRDWSQLGVFSEQRLGHGWSAISTEDGAMA
jgi:hypothetical protein